MVTRTSDDFTLECVGVLANLVLPELDYSTLLQQYNLVPWIISHLMPGKVEDDFVLEVVMLVATTATDEACASLLCKADILLSLIELLKGMNNTTTKNNLPKHMFICFCLLSPPQIINLINNI